LAQGLEPTLTVLGNFKESKIRFAKAEGFTSIGLGADPGMSLDAARIKGGAG
jgi:hypothetical protein